MAEFLVRAADDRGNLIARAETAATEVELRDRLEAQGYHVFEVRGRGLLSTTRRRVSHEQFIIFNQQFVTLIHAGLPIVQSLELLSKRQRDARLREVLENVRDQVKGGKLLSEAFEAQGVFPKIYTTTLLAGEKSGELEEVLGRYVQLQRLTMAFRKKLIGSLIYPTFLFVAIVLVFSILMLYVVPNFARLFEELGQPLPPITQMVIGLSHEFVAIAPFAAVALIAIIAGLWRWAKTDAGGITIDRVKLGIPFLGVIWQRYQTSAFARMLATLLAGGLPLVQGMQTAGDSISSRLMRQSIATATRQVREGQPLSRSLEGTGFFPELMVEMVEVGESTGALPQMLTSTAEFYEEDVQTAIGSAMQMIEPVTLVVMGVIVGFILFALYMPIFSLGANLH